MIKLLIACVLLALVYGCTAGRPSVNDTLPYVHLPIEVRRVYADYPDTVLNEQLSGAQREFAGVGVRVDVINVIDFHLAFDSLFTNAMFSALPSPPDYITVYLFDRIEGQLDVKNPEKSFRVVGLAGARVVALAASNHIDDRTLAHELGHIFLPTRPGMSESDPDREHDPWWQLFFRTNMGTRWPRAGWTNEQARTIYNNVKAMTEDQGEVQQANNP